MPKEKPIELITPPNVLKAKLGGPLSKDGSDAIERAEKALQSLSHEFEDWLREELDRLEAKWESAKSLTNRENQLTDLYGAAHDLKGLAATYGYPLITRFAASLCVLIGDTAARAAAPYELIDAHIKTCRVAMRDTIKDDTHPVGAALAQELETQVGTLLKAA